MSTAVSEERMAELERKLDFIVEELAALRRVRNSAEDLMADLMLVSRSAMGDATRALGSAALRPREIVNLLKTVLVNAQLLEATLQQLQSAADFVQDVQPIVRDLFKRAIAGSQVLEQRGYMQAAGAGLRVGDALVRAHSPEDWRQVEASLPQLIGFLRELTHPEALEALEVIIHGFGRVQATMNVDKSVLALARDLRTPEARRGLAILVEFLKVIGTRTAAQASTSTSTQPAR